MQEDIILKVENLSVELEQEKILNNLNFDIKKGETLVILGPNGAGKTILLRTLLGFLPYQGKIKWQKGVTIGYVPQRLPLIKDFPLSVKEFFTLKRNSIEDIYRILNLIGFKEEGILDKRIGEISSGQFQRILVGWSLIGDPQILLFDEPTAGIDIGGEETIYSLLDKLQKEKNLTIVLVSHDLSVVYKRATSVLCLNRQALCYGSPQEVLNPKNLQKLYGQELTYYQHRH